ncbi:regular [Carabus blaptoides fortunei]
MFNKLMAYAVSQNVPIYLCENVMCRLCGCTGNNTSYILLKESCYLVKMIKDETQIRIKEEDVYPRTVCRGCVDKIHMIQHFRSHCKKTQKVLESMFRANNKCQNQTNMIALHSANEQSVKCEQINLPSEQINTEILDINEANSRMNTVAKQTNIKTENESRMLHADTEDDTMEVEWLEDEFSTFQSELNTVPEHNTETTGKYAVIYGDSTTFRSIHISLLENELSQNATVVPPKILGQMKKKRVEVVPKEELSKLASNKSKGSQSKNTRSKICESNDNLECVSVEHVSGQYDNLYVKLNDADSNAPLLFRLLSDNTSSVPVTTEQYHDTQDGRVIDCSTMEHLNFTVIASNELEYRHNEELVHNQHDMNTTTQHGTENNNNTETYIVQTQEELQSEKQEYKQALVDYESQIPVTTTTHHAIDTETCINQQESFNEQSPTSKLVIDQYKDDFIIENQSETEDNTVETLEDQQTQVDVAETEPNQTESNANHLVQNINQQRRTRKHIRASRFKKQSWSTPEIRVDRSGRVFKSIAHRYVERVSPWQYQCFICEKTFRYPFKAELHVRRHIGEKPFACTQCNKRFITGFYLMKHERTHAISQFICEICGKNFREIYTLRDHQRIHLDAQPQFHCTTCDKTFFTKSTFDGHRLTHAEKKHICEKCGKRFSLYAMMSRHRNRHGTARYQCQKCPKVLKTREDSIQHRKRHERNGLYRCAPCSLSFWTHKGLHMHERQMHSLTNNNPV